jgi:hypothetical protein
MLLCTVSAAINFSALLDAMSHNSAITMGAGWRHCMNRAFKAVEGHRSILDDLERLVVFIAAIVHLAIFVVLGGDPDCGNMVIPISGS